MRHLFSKALSPIHQRQESLAREAEELEFELNVLKTFLHAAPQLHEESRYLIPPPEEAVREIAVPNRAALKHVRRESYYYGAKLLLLLSLFLVASIWFVDRMLTVMR